MLKVYLFGMSNSVNKLLKALNETTVLSEDKWTKEHLYISGNKKWVANIVPAELLQRTVKDAVNSLMTLNESGVFYKNFPKKLKLQIMVINGAKLQITLRYDTNTHHLIMCNPSYSDDGTALNHWQNLFAGDDGREYNGKVSELFVHSLNL